MNAATPTSAAPGQARSARYHLMRSRKDIAARWLIRIGGISVILAVVLILFYLLTVVFPLFTPASTHLEPLGSQSAWRNQRTAGN